MRGKVRRIKYIEQHFPHNSLPPPGQISIFICLSESMEYFEVNYDPLVLSLESTLTQLLQQEQHSKRIQTLNML
jgi:hypothetical protein